MIPLSTFLCFSLSSLPRKMILSLSGKPFILYFNPGFSIVTESIVDSSEVLKLLAQLNKHSKVVRIEKFFLK